MADGLYPARSYPKPDGSKSKFEIQMEKDHHAREFLIAVEEIKIMQQQLRDCYIREVCYQW